MRSHDKPRRGGGTQNDTKKERGSDVGDRHLDERELELQSLAGLHEVLGAAILGGDLHAWSG